MEVTIDQVQAATGIPSFAKKFVGDEINIVQQESWTSATEGDIRVTIPGKPGEMKGTARLTESGGVTTETVDLDDQGQHPAGRRQDRGPDRRPAAQGAQGREPGRSRLPLALSLALLLGLLGRAPPRAAMTIPSTTNGPERQEQGQRLLDRVQRSHVEGNHRVHSALTRR